MISIFRKLRKRLVSKNRLGKYLKYAVGEITLLVIGILIALSLNNWNEKRKENRLWEKYKSNLREEVTSNLEQTQALIKWHTKKYQYGELVLNALTEGNNTSDNEGLFVAVELVGWLFTTGYVQDVWGELLNTGNMKLIENDNLRSNLIKLYREINQYNKNSEELNSYILGYRRIVTLYIPAKLRLDFKKFAPNRFYIGGFENSPEMNKVLDDFRNHKDLQGYLVDMMMTSDGLKSTNLESQLKLFQEILMDLE